MRAARLLVVVVLAFGAHSAFADARNQARKAFERGMSLIAQKKFGPGIEELIKANQIVPHPDVQYNIARACLDAGLLPEAIEWFETYLQQPTPPPDEEEIKAAIASMRAKIAPPRAAVVEKREEPASDELPEGDEPVQQKRKAALLPEDTARELRRLEQLAQDMKPLAEDRSKELASIAQHMRELAQVAQQNGDHAPPKKRDDVQLAEPTKTEPPKLEQPALEVKLDKQGLREVEEYEEQQVVTAATRRAARAQDAPAVVWVITQREIRERGYESVAEALRAVAGLHVVDDHVFIDVGIRGVHAGLRGMSRILKVLVDDHPIAFRPTSGSLLGLEMIPIRAVDRIELIRGPASALYGANAFLGVLQIVTRRGGDIRGGSVGGRIGITTETRDASGRIAPQASVSADAVVGTQEGIL